MSVFKRRMTISSCYSKWWEYVASDGSIRSVVLDVAVPGIKPKGCTPKGFPVWSTGFSLLHLLFHCHYAFCSCQVAG